MKMQVVTIFMMVLLLTQDIGFAMKKTSMMTKIDEDGDGKKESMKNDQELEPNNRHWIPRGSWQSGQGQGGQSSSTDNLA